MAGDTRSLSVLGTLTVLLGALAGGAHAEDLFLTSETVSLHQPAIKSLVEDLNGDGFPDAVVAHQDAAQIGVLLNDSSGGFLAPVTLDVGLTPVALASGDVDGDGAPDVVVVNYGTGTVSVFRNSGDGSLEKAAEVPVSGLQARAAQVADLDSDGRGEILVTDLGSSRLTVLRTDGQGGFEKHQVVDVLGNPHSLSVADFDGDGAVDAAVTVYEELGVEGRVQWFAGNGDGTLSLAGETRVGEGTAFRYSVSGDFDGDNRPDLCVLDLWQSVFLLKNRGNWSFEVVESPCCTEAERPIEVDARTWNGFILGVDHDSDGDLDVVTRVRSGNARGYRVLENDGDGSFESARTVLLDREFRVLALADFDGDGIQDGLATSTRPELLLYQGASPGRLITPETYYLSQAPTGLGLLRSLGAPPALVAYSTQTLHFLRFEENGSGEAVSMYHFLVRSFQGLVIGEFDRLPGHELALTDLARRSVVFLSVGPEGPVENGIEVTDLDAPGRMAAGDFDRDGVTDLAVLHQGRAWVTILLRPGVASQTGEDSPRETLMHDSTIRHIEVADLDGDGLLDLILAGGDDLQVLLGNGAGKFPASRLLRGDTVVRGTRAASLDGNGIPDLLVAERKKLLVGYNVLEDDPPVFSEIGLPFTVADISVGDVNGDGEPDVLLGAEELNAVALLPGAGEGVLGEPEYYRLGGPPTELALADFDRDGALDVAAASFSTQSVALLRGLQPARIGLRRGDINLDGRSDLSDAVMLLGALFLGQGSLRCPDAADSDDSGRVSLTDAIFLLLHLFRGGERPPDPGPWTCGPDPTEDTLEDCGTPCW